MPPTDTSEKGLETLIVDALTGRDRAGNENGAGLRIGEEPDPVTGYRTGGFIQGESQDYDRLHVLDTVKLIEFLKVTQPKVVEAFGLEEDGPSREKFLSRVQGQVAERGIVDVLRKGVKHQSEHVTLFYGTPTPGNFDAAVKHGQNIFSVTRQLRYSADELANALDLALFINGLPVATFELKNNLTKQTVDDAVRQYQTDRSPQEALFRQGTCIAHFAVDEHNVKFCTALAGKKSWFLPFDRGFEQGGGNPPNPNGIQTDYLWNEILQRESLTNIIENYAARIEEKDEKTGKKKFRQIFPRYHQLDVVRKLLKDAETHGVGQRYLIQHSAGSGKSNSIAWLAHQLVSLKRDGQPVFDSVVVVTDRVVLDDQLKQTVKQFTQVSATVGWAQSSGDLRAFLDSGKKIVVSTIQKFPFVLDEIQNALKDRNFAIIIDEAHSGQGGSATRSMSRALGSDDEDDDDDQTVQDKINAAIESRKLLKNASYFAFTATPKNKTLQLFGTPVMEGGEIRRKPFHVYSMKQAIEEKFILDVLQSYTPYHSFYHLTKEIEGDPEFDKKRAQRKLKAFVEGHDAAIEEKAQIIVEHFHQSVQFKIDGEARAMVVCNGVERAIKYHRAIERELKARKSKHKSIVAFSGERKFDGDDVSEASLNGFPSGQIKAQFKEGDYRFLICADKFQTGYDEPLLHTMYVDKPLAGIKAVQTLSRLNRAMPGKSDTFVLDFFNDTEVIEASFQEFYQTTILSRDADPNKLHDLQARLDEAEVYSWELVETVAARFLHGDDRVTWQPFLDQAVANYKALEQDEQIAFKHQAKTFVRGYNFLAAVLPYGNAEWEQLSIFLTFLIPSLPSIEIDDLTDGILQSVDLDSYRAEKLETLKIGLATEDATIDPPQDGVGGVIPEPELDRLSVIVQAFNEQFGNIDWKDEDRIRKVVTEEIPELVRQDKAVQNALNQGDVQKIRIELARAMQEIMGNFVADHTDLYKHYADDPVFKKLMLDIAFQAVYEAPAG